MVRFDSRNSGLVDIVLLQEDQEGHRNADVIFEIKRHQRKQGLEQLKNYCNTEWVQIDVLFSENEIIRAHLEDLNIFVEIPRIPKYKETIRDILTERSIIRWFEEYDELRQNKTTFKKILLDLDELILSNVRVDASEEIFKLIYVKLYNELRRMNDIFYQLKFFIVCKNPEKIKEVLL